MMRTLFRFVSLLFLVLAWPAVAQAPTAEAAPPDPPAAPAGGIVDIETVVVSGALPGPGLWTVRHGEHTLHLLATVSPLPRRMDWDSVKVESVIARSQRVVSPPSLTVDPGVGMFRGMLLLPSLLKARKNPDGRSLQKVVPPALYARWQPLKQRYLGNDRGVEQWRPIFAAQELYEAAMRRSGLSQEDVVGKAIARMAKRHGVPVRAVNHKLKIDDAKSAIRQFRETTLADTECFEKTLSRIEHDLEAMRQRANAWAVGDIEALRRLTGDSQYAACVRAVTETGLAQKLGLGDVRARVAELWLETAEAALREEAVSFGSLPLGLVIGADGYLARLEAKGYRVEPPGREAGAAEPALRGMR